MKKILILLYFLSFMCACSDESNNAEQLQISNLRNAEFYSWFSIAYDNYLPYEELLPEIQKQFNYDEYKIVIFTTPNCGCNDEYTKFPKFIKVLDSAKITEENYEIYLMKAGYFHPYQNIIDIKAFPAFVLMKNNVPIYSINDTILTGRKSYFSQDVAMSLEEGLYEAIQKAKTK